MPLNRRYFFLSSFFTGAFCTTACTIDRRPRLNVFNWSNYIAASTIPAFEREFQVRVRYQVYESNEEMLAKVMTGNSGWDVVFPTHSRIQPMTAAGLLAPLVHSKFKNMHNLAQQFRAPPWDPSLAHSIPYMWNGTGIAYSRKVQPAPTHWSDLWSPRWQRRVTMLDDPEDVLGACLEKLNLPFDSANPADLARAKQEAVAQKPKIRAYLNAEVRDQLVSGDVLAAQAWSTTAQQAIAASKNLGFVYPNEGFPLYADNVVILRESTRPELAHEFLDFLLRPEIAAANAVEAETATTNEAARLLLPEAIRTSPTLYPTAETQQRAIWPRALPGPAMRLRDRIWTEIKAF